MNPNTHAPSNPEILLLGIYPTQISEYVYKKTYTRISIVVLFIKAPKEKKHLSINKRLNNYVVLYSHDGILCVLKQTNNCIVISHYVGWKNKAE